MLVAAAPAFFLVRLLCTSSAAPFRLSFKARPLYRDRGLIELAAHQMDKVFGADENSLHACMRLQKVAGHMTEILELHAEQPLLQILFIPGNPGIVSFYRDYMEAVFEQLDRKVSVTAIGHIGHTSKDWEDGRLFSLQDQITHKAGHSIGAYISLDIFKAFPGKVSYMIGMYPFLRMNKESSWSPVVCATLSSFAALMGQTPPWFHKGLVKRLLGREWSSNAIDIACTYLLQYSMVRNLTFMGMTEFKTLQENPDWAFIREKEDQIAFLFGIDDHWGPLSLYEEGPDICV